MSIIISTQPLSNDHSYMMTTTVHGVTENKPFRTPFEGKYTIVSIVALLSLIHITVLVIAVNCFIQDRVIREEIPLIERPTGDKNASEALCFETTHFENTETSTTRCSGTVALQFDDTKADSPKPSITRADDPTNRLEHYPGQQTMQTILKQINEKGFKWKTCLETIRNDTDVSKLSGFEMEQKDPYFTEVRTRIDVPGYQAYEIPFNDTASLYEIVSVQLCGDINMEAIIRVAVARSALNNYTQNVKKLVDMFSKSTDAVQEAKTFFDAHRIYYKVTNLKRDVEHCYFERMREIIVEGRSKGPMHVELFGEVLNCYKIQHDDGGCFDGKCEKMLPGLNIGLYSCEPIDRELCVYWLWSDSHDPGQYIIIPLLKNDKKYE
ncbi:uncharacterized protein LOC127857712 isoform X2 [Dreissena polymorpha]|nr:uncharacterized protein LOC127857712 isoform X2 [Dreissena polymorpha]XP_052250328.1 uncharacterized protein LOC127857712 isoform X2 [Dreissena polymorpha]XP_052250329.1 uncharacterized protein LOC127857712 isoform X2 [Dreissena polymorpha]XP_052250330.1 uncharacterized protein LOC127857712 isoform X2 [Dreissena polymorpha]